MTEQDRAAAISEQQLAALGLAVADRLRGTLEACWEVHDPEEVIEEGLPYEELDVEARNVLYDPVDPCGRTAYTLHEVVRLDLRAGDRDLLALARHRPAELAAAIDAAAVGHRLRAVHGFSITGGTELLLAPAQRLAQAAAQGPRLPAPAPSHTVAEIVARLGAVREAIVGAGIELTLDSPTAPSSVEDIDALEAAVGWPLPAALRIWLQQAVPGFEATVRPRGEGPFAFVGWCFASAAEIRAALDEKRDSWVDDDETIPGPYVSPKEARALLAGCVPLSVWESFFFLSEGGAVCFYEEGGLVRPPLAPDLHTFLERWRAIGFFSQREYAAYAAVFGQALGLPLKDGHALIYALA